MLKEVSHKFPDNSMTEESHDYCLNETLFDNHQHWLVKCKADTFLKLRLFTYAKMYNEKIL